MTRKDYTPHPYQYDIQRHQTEHDRNATFAGMGMGKTVATLTTLDNNILAGESHPALILAPTRVCRTTWPLECRKWSHLASMEVVPIVGTARERLDALKQDAPVYACNYDNLPWLVDHYGAHWPFRTVVADESTRLKSFRIKRGGVRARSLGQVAHSKIKKFYLLTGTPAPNGLQDLWGQIWMLDKGDRLGRSYTSYMERFFCTPRNGFGKELRSELHAGQVYDLLRDICLTVAPEDYFDLDAPIVQDIVVDMPDKARTIYNRMKRDLITMIENHEISAANAAVKAQKLLQLSNGAAYLDPDVDDDDHPKAKRYKVVHDAKIEALDSIITESAGAPVLVSYSFRSDRERILKAFKQAKVLDGDPDVIDQWNAGKVPVLLAHPASAGHGLNLQDGGHRLAFFGHTWSLEDRLQILERLGPMRQKQSGHNRPVFIYNIITDATMDRAVVDRVDGKRSVMDALTDNLKRGK